MVIAMSDNTRDNFDRLYNVALNFLAHKPRTEHEVRKKLEAYIKLKDLVVSPDDISGVIEALFAEKYINDNEYADQFINYQTQAHKKSIRLIRKFLADKGIAPDVLDLKLGKNGPTDAVTVLSMMEKKLRALEGKAIPPQKLRQKLITYLLGKGFDYDDVFDAVDRQLGVK